MSANHRTNLKKQGEIIKNTLSVIEDKLLFEANEKLETYLRGNIEIPDGWDIEHFKTIPTKLIILKLRNDGIPYSRIKYLESPNPNGESSEIKPDGGCVAAVKRDNKENIIAWYPLVISESKHQGTDDKPEQAKGNAIERVFKNYNVTTKLCHRDKVTPFVCFCQGCDMESEFIRNKIRQGACEPGLNTIKNDDYDFRQVSFWMRKEPWNCNEIFEKIKSCALEAFEYYKPNMD